MSEAAKKLSGDEHKIRGDAVGDVEEEEDEHLYHTAGWTGELWIESLGLPAVLPPPEKKRMSRMLLGRPAQSMLAPYALSSQACAAIHRVF